MSENQSPQPSDSLYDDTTTEDVLRDIWNDIVQKDDDAHGETVQPENSTQTERSLDALDSSEERSGERSEERSEEPVPEQMTLSSVMSEPIPTIGQPELSGPAEAIDAVDEAWDDAELPGTVSLSNAGPAKEITPSAAEKTVGKSDEQAQPIATGREKELLTLIHDLNECNDALLTRVSQLEGELDETQRTRQTEAEQAQIAQYKLSERVSVEQASAQEVSLNAQQQVAKLVAQLESTQQALQRQHLVTQTLQAELENNQERITQLEHECALTTQQHAAEAQARIQAETSNRDLRSRLQRQQRYTLQFKAALEKSLTVSARSATDFNTADCKTSSFNTRAAAQPTAFTEKSAVSMPKAQQIMPWASASTVPFEGIDPHLENLIRSASQRGSLQPSTPSASRLDATASGAAGDSKTESNVAPTADPEAENQLWQDLERVMDITDTPDIESILSEKASNTAASNTAASNIVEPQSAKVSESSLLAPEEEEASKDEALSLIDSETAAQLEETSAAGSLQADVSEGDPLETDVTEGKSASGKSPKATTFNWQKDAENQFTTAPADSEPVTKSLSNDLANDLGGLPAATTNLPSLVIEPYSPPAGEPLPASAVAFTEPSPWGRPLPAPGGKSADQDDERESQYLPAVEDETSDIAPVVNRLRAQKKISSLSAVQLPTFETAKSGSFKR